MLYVNPLADVSALKNTTAASAMGTTDPTRRKAALEELEHFFLFQLIQEMRKSIPDSSTSESKAAKDIYNEMMDDALSGVMAKSGQLGIASTIEQQILAAEKSVQLRAQLAQAHQADSSKASALVCRYNTLGA